MLTTIEKLHQKAKGLPLEPGVYIMKDARGKVIYIGKAKKLRTRVSSYFKPGADHDLKTRKMVSLVEDFDIIVASSEYEALALESSLIKQQRPKYNILLKDDKGFAYIRVSDEEYPRISYVLQKRNDNAKYYGPYLNGLGTRQMVETVVLAFMLPTCKRRFPQEIGRGRPCLNGHLGRCMKVCSGAISPEEYRAVIDDAITMLTKGSSAILAKLRADMQRASDNMEFERAARIRDSIAAIEKMESGQKVIKDDENAEMDVFAFAGNEKCVCGAALQYRKGRLTDKVEQIIYDTADIAAAREEFVTHFYIDNRDVPKRIVCDADFESRENLERLLREQTGRAVHIQIPQRGENKRLVELAYSNAADRVQREAGRRDKDEAALAELANLLGFSELPHRIEAYDISNYGEQAVAGMVVFTDGHPDRSQYRRFIIKEVSGVDDYASMAETLRRRIKRYEAGDAGFSQKPDLILLDGGRGHLTTALAVMKDGPFVDVPAFGMVKDAKHRTRGIVGELGELDVGMHKSAFVFVSKIQNEVHRFTITYQRNRHSSGAIRSSLLDIDGVGESRAKALMKHFKTIAALKQASREEIEQVPGMTKTVADAIWRHYNA